MQIKFWRLKIPVLPFLMASKMLFHFKSLCIWFLDEWYAHHWRYKVSVQRYNLYISTLLCYIFVKNQYCEPQCECVQNQISEWIIHGIWKWINLRFTTQKWFRSPSFYLFDFFFSVSHLRFAYDAHLFAVTTKCNINSNLRFIQIGHNCAQHKYCFVYSWIYHKNISTAE